MKEQLAKDIQHILAVQFAFDVDGKTIARELIDHTQHAEGLAIMGSIHDEVTRPDMVARFWPQSDA